MNSFFQAARGLLQVETLVGCLRAEWGSQPSPPPHKHRLEIRKGLFSTLKKLQKSALLETEKLFNLDAPLTEIREMALFVSISHAPSLGGFALSDHPIGFDIEKVDKVTLKIARRISSETELKQAPSPAHLWCAKEAAFKCLNPSQINLKTIGQIEIASWEEPSPGVFSFTLSHSSGMGLSMENKSGHTLCLFCKKT